MNKFIQISDFFFFPVKMHRGRRQGFGECLSLSLTLQNFWKAHVSIRRGVFGSCTGSLVGQPFSGSCSSTLIYFKPSVKLARSQVLHLQGLKQCSGSRPSLHTAIWSFWGWAQKENIKIYILFWFTGTARRHGSFFSPLLPTWSRFAAFHFWMPA